MIRLLEKGESLPEEIALADAVGAAVAADLGYFGAGAADAFFYLITDEDGELAGAAGLTPLRGALCIGPNASAEEIRSFFADTDGLLVYPSAAVRCGLRPSLRAWYFAGKPYTSTPGDVCPVTTENLDAVLELQNSVFDVRPEAAQIRRSVLFGRLARGAIRGFAVFEDGEPVSAAMTDCEAGGNALVEGVCSRPDRRGAGAARSALWALTDSLLCEGMSPTLFTELNDLSGFYTACGFVSL